MTVFIFLDVVEVQTAHFDITKDARDGPTKFLTSGHVLRLPRKKNVIVLCQQVKITLE